MLLMALKVFREVISQMPAYRLVTVFALALLGLALTVRLTL
jgi:hypothetical protein